MANYINTDLSKYSDAEFSAYAESITSNMNGNPEYPAPPVPIATITAMLPNFRDYLIDPERLSPYDRKQRDKIRDTMQGLLKRDGQYVILLFPDDELKQVASGFPPARPRVRMTVPPEKPGNLRVRQGYQSGQAILNCKKKPGTRSINIRIYDELPDSTPRIVNSTSTVGVTIHDLVPGRQYFFAVQALGAKGTSDWAGPVDLYVA